MYIIVSYKLIRDKTRKNVTPLPAYFVFVSLPRHHLFHCQTASVRTEKLKIIEGRHVWLRDKSGDDNGWKRERRGGGRRGQTDSDRTALSATRAAEPNGTRHLSRNATLQFSQTSPASWVWLSTSEWSERRPQALIKPTDPRMRRQRHTEHLLSHWSHNRPQWLSLCSIHQQQLLLIHRNGNTHPV